ncbi:MAG: acylphosphatase [Bacteroidetes bacterium]|nr:acylphosphatase [Bacteroidota bacterium]HNR19701.1 acylphosphatase [Bacteroidia bacterium]HNU34365.1 acylphosphatase [Bacteroidia bacterium]
MKTISILVKGKVQGVFFRKYAKDKADELDVSGFVKNINDGSVYIEATGNEDALNKLVAWCNHGPMLAQVASVETNLMELHDFDGFEISY